MGARNLIRIVGVVVVMTWALVSASGSPPAVADPCSDAEVVFARGTGEPVGLGGVGQAFVDSLRSQLPGSSIGAYPVNYPATDDYRNSALAGAGDASAHIGNVIANCPNTKLVLGGYSQGASVIDFSSASMPPQTAGHVAAVALFGNPSSPYASSLMGGQLPTLSPPYRPKAIDLCIPDDIICSEGGNMVPHLLYVQSGMADQAATFVAGRLQPGSSSNSG
ncbi:cutinase family protein [Mycobacterium fragae]|jgi:cutinase|uniref:Cutinase n=1 Tax=Mycobacterium fragae TaxID=1260918 RepID=A0A1X1UJ80_9MYCO|nr:cutinase family protein [Mycobacterium fragae]MCV7401197.1 cutinase family protein [Mycobacterium fragae]ORV56867.1 cutinase [Mycobacterium fragae]